MLTKANYHRSKLAKDIQVQFWIEGLITPREGVVLRDSIVVKGAPSIRRSCMFFKITQPEGEKPGKSMENCRNALKNILEIYGLITDRYIESSYGCGISELSSEHPFAVAECINPPVQIDYGGVFIDRTKDIPFLKKTITKYREIARAILEERT